MNTPLLDALLDHIRLGAAPFHMPGHKGRMKELEGMANVSALDVTELPDTGDLYAGGDAIEEAERLWADAWQFDCCQFLTGGSTQGLHAALLLCAQTGKGVLMDRCCHRSVYNALGLYDLSPAYLFRQQTQPLDPRMVEAALERDDTLKTVCITSPTYYGVLSDIPAIADIAHRHGAKLIVDAAHGAHLPFLGLEPCKGADLAVTSAHKTMAAYGQAALLFSNGTFTDRDLRWAASVCGTSSPSFPILASLDYARDFLESKRGRANMDWAVGTCKALESAFPHLRLPRGAARDPMRFVLAVNALAADGFAVKDWLERHNVFPEMADRDHVVFLLSPSNTEADAEALFEKLGQLSAVWPGVFDGPMDPPALPGEPAVVLTPAQALTRPRTMAVLADSEGRTCLQQVAPYPPGVPVIAPGERITKKSLAYLRELGYNVYQQVYIDRLEEGEEG